MHSKDIYYSFIETTKILPDFVQAGSISLPLQNELEAIITQQSQN